MSWLEINHNQNFYPVNDGVFNKHNKISTGMKKMKKGSH